MTDPATIPPLVHGPDGPVIVEPLAHALGVKLADVLTLVDREIAEPFDEGSQWMARCVRAVITGEVRPSSPDVRTRWSYDQR